MSWHRQQLITTNYDYTINMNMEKLDKWITTTWATVVEKYMLSTNANGSSAATLVKYQMRFDGAVRVTRADDPNPVYESHEGDETHREEAIEKFNILGFEDIL